MLRSLPPQHSPLQPPQAIALSIQQQQRRPLEPSALVVPLLDTILLFFFVDLASLAFAQLPFAAFPCTVVAVFDDEPAIVPLRMCCNLLVFGCCFGSWLGRKLEAVGTLRHQGRI